MNIVFFSAVKYNSVISGRTKQLALELSKLGHNIIFIEMPSVRNIKFPFFQLTIKDNIQIITLPPFLFSFYLLDTIWGLIWIKLVVCFLRRKYSFENIHCIVSNPWWTMLLSSMSFKSITYDCIDHISVHCKRKHLVKMKKYENKLIEISNNIFIICNTLKNELNNIAKCNVRLIPNGVPRDWFDIKSLNFNKEKLTAGFIGALYEWIDQDLIIFSALALPNVNFVLIGPTRNSVSCNRLSKIKNISIYQDVPFREVPKAIAEFDVCLIPFKQDIVSDCADPLKLYEYLALGKPVVSSIKCGDAPIYYGNDKELFVDKIKKALNEKNIGIRERIEFAKLFTWDTQAKKIIEVLSDRKD